MFLSRCTCARNLQANMVAAGLGAINLVLYTLIYTPLKQIHPVNTWVGAVVGAIPPLLGYVACTLFENASLCREFEFAMFVMLLFFP